MKRTSFWKIFFIIIITSKLGCESKPINKVWKVTDAQFAQNGSSEKKYQEKITVLTLVNTDICLGKQEWEIEAILHPTEAQSLNKEMNC